MCRLYHLLLVSLNNGLRMINNLIRLLFMREVCFIDTCLVYQTSTIKMIARVRSFCNMFLYVLNSVINKVSKYMKRIWWIGNHKTAPSKWRQHISCFTAVNRNAPIQQIKHNRNMSVLLGMTDSMIMCQCYWKAIYYDWNKKRKNMYRAGQKQWWTAGLNLYKQNTTSCLMGKLCGGLYHWLYTKCYISDAYKIFQLCVNLVWVCLVDTLIQWIVEIWNKAIISVSRDCMAKTMTTTQNHIGKGFGYCQTSEQKVWPLMRTRNSWSWTKSVLSNGLLF